VSSQTCPPRSVYVMRGILLGLELKDIEVVFDSAGLTLATSSLTIDPTLMIWKSVTGVPEENFVILETAQRRPASQHQANVARAERLTRLAKYCGYASLGLLVISGGVWVYRGIVAVNGGRTP
jgi:hypothetical protein